MNTEVFEDLGADTEFSGLFFGDGVGVEEDKDTAVLFEVVDCSGEGSVAGTV